MTHLIVISGFNNLNSALWMDFRDQSIDSQSMTDIEFKLYLLNAENLPYNALVVDLTSLHGRGITTPR